MGWLGTAFNVLADPGGILGVDGKTATEGGFGILGDSKTKPITPDMNVGMYGGDQVTSDAYRNQWQNGIRSGSGQVDQGLGLLNTSAQAGGVLQRGGYDATQQGMGDYRMGLGMAGQSRGNQMEAARLEYLAATGQAPSQAQLLMKGAGDQQAQQMMAQAQAARGGNAASAMRGAQYQAAQGNAQMSQQLAALRANEMAQARGAYGNISTQIRGQDLGTAGMGAQMTGLGFNAQNAGMQGIANAGAQTANVGMQREGNYLGTLNNQLQNEAASKTDLEMARIGQLQAARDADARRKGATLGAVGSIFGAFYGGPGGAQAGGAAGQSLGGATG